MFESRFIFSVFLRARVARSLLALIAGCFAAAIATLPAQADAVADWNRIAADTINAPSGSFPAVTDEERRPIYATDLATVHVAIYDAVNAIVGGYQPYAIRPRAPTRGASPEAATAAATCRVLYRLFPNRAPRYEVPCAPFLANSPGSAAVLRGIAVGVEVADGILALRAGDGRMAPAAYDITNTAPGRFVPFPLTTAPVNVFLPNVRPFALTNNAQFRAPGPPVLGSARYTADYEQVRVLGSATSTVRTPSQSEIARFHTEAPPLFWPRNLRQFARDSRRLADNARLFALLWVAHSDAAAACFESKYFHNFWRPRTGIPRGNEDGNAATVADPAWTTYLPTPNQPDYPAAHSCIAGAMAEVLRDFAGTKRQAFTLDSTAFLAIPGDGSIHVHNFTNTDDMVTELSVARIYAGIHFRTATQDGAHLGRKVAQWVGHRFFRPVHPRNEHADAHGHGERD